MIVKLLFYGYCDMLAGSLSGLRDHPVNQWQPQFAGNEGSDSITFCTRAGQAFSAKSQRVNVVSVSLGGKIEAITFAGQPSPGGKAAPRRGSHMLIPYSLSEEAFEELTQFFYSPRQFCSSNLSTLKARLLQQERGCNPQALGTLAQVTFAFRNIGQFLGKFLGTRKVLGVGTESSGCIYSLPEGRPRSHVTGCPCVPY